MLQIITRFSKLVCQSQLSTCTIKTFYHSRKYQGLVSQNCQSLSLTSTVQWQLVTRCSKLECKSVTFIYMYYKSKVPRVNKLGCQSLSYTGTVLCQLVTICNKLLPSTCSKTFQCWQYLQDLVSYSVSVTASHISPVNKTRDLSLL